MEQYSWRRRETERGQEEVSSLMEYAIRQPNIAKSEQRYQLAVDDAKVTVYLVVCSGTWLIRAKMLIGKESIVSYNNQLKQVVPG